MHGLAWCSRRHVEAVVARIGEAAVEVLLVALPFSITAGDGGPNLQALAR